ncbi:MAG: response regulator transcription factor [Candidatus Eremiobacteraeota bacterium]|nr:response regulator transcription factor [Candidatus Eremiobacteraeota bacterium]
MIRVALVDDHAMVREGLTNLLKSSDMQVVFSVAGAEEALSKLSETQIDVLVTDLALPEKDGVFLIREVRQQYSNLPILVLSMHKGQDSIMSALDAGANGYVHKSNENTVLKQAIRILADGGSHLSPQIANLVLSAYRRRKDTEKSLTDREVSVLRLAALGMTNLEIADRVHLSESTVKIALRQAYRKLDAGSRAQAVKRASELGLLSSGHAHPEAH